MRHHFVIKNDGTIGKDAELWIDGMKMLGVTRATLVTDSQDANRVIVEFIAESVNSDTGIAKMMVTKLIGPK